MLENQQSVSEERHAPGFSYLVGWLLGWNSTNEVQIRVFGCHDTDRIEVSEETQRLLNTMLLFPSTIVKKNSKFHSLQTKRRPLYLKTQSVPRCKHFSSGL